MKVILTFSFSNNILTENQKPFLFLYCSLSNFRSYLKPCDPSNRNGPIQELKSNNKFTFKEHSNLNGRPKCCLFCRIFYNVDLIQRKITIKSICNFLLFVSSHYSINSMKFCLVPGCRQLKILL